MRAVSAMPVRQQHVVAKEEGGEETEKEKETKEDLQMPLRTRLGWGS